MIDFLTHNITYNKVYIHPIWADVHLHAVNNKLSMIYVYDIESGKEHIVNIGNIDYHTTDIKDVVFDVNEAYIFDKKQFLKVMDIPNAIDCDVVKYFSDNLPLTRLETPTHSFFYRKFNNVRWVNNLIPISKHIEMIRPIRDEFLRYYRNGVGITDVMKKFDNFFITALNHIEQNGLQTTNGIEYSEYHPYTLTSRPSNSFGGVNYAALNKDNGDRDRFISRFEGGKLYQFDYDAYHPRIIGRLVGEPIDVNISGHQALADMYGVSYSESKAITFRQLYGGVQDEYMHIPLFSKTSKYIDLLWIEYFRNGYIRTPMGRVLQKKNLTNMNANKLFNYMLQATETELNMKILTDLVKFMENYRSKVILYTYDSYLLDIHPDEINIIKDIKILIEGNGFPTKIECGDTYSDMKSI